MNLPVACNGIAASITMMLVNILVVNQMLLSKCSCLNNNESAIEHGQEKSKGSNVLESDLPKRTNSFVAMHQPRQQGKKFDLAAHFDLDQTLIGFSSKKGGGSAYFDSQEEADERAYILNGAKKTVQFCLDNGIEPIVVTRSDIDSAKWKLNAKNVGLIDLIPLSNVYTPSEMNVNVASKHKKDCWRSRVKLNLQELAIADTSQRGGLKGIFHLDDDPNEVDGLRKFMDQNTNIEMRVVGIQEKSEQEEIEEAKKGWVDHPDSLNSIVDGIKKYYSRMNEKANFVAKDHAMVREELGRFLTKIRSEPD